MASTRPRRPSAGCLGELVAQLVMHLSKGL